MNKPLTIEQLKSLEVDDWVWIDFRDIYPYYVGQVQTGYYEISLQYEDEPYEITELWLYGEDFIIQLKYSDYGTRWLAYKNKEQAEGEDSEMIEQIEKAYEHNVAECERCMKRVDIKHQFAMESMKEHIRKETAKEILQEVYKNAGGRWLTELCEKYGAEVDE